jgi:hypothetical protein
MCQIYQKMRDINLTDEILTGLILIIVICNINLLSGNELLSLTLGSVIQQISKSCYLKIFVFSVI